MLLVVIFILVTHSSVQFILIHNIRIVHAAHRFHLTKYCTESDVNKWSKYNWFCLICAHQMTFPNNISAHICFFFYKYFNTNKFHGGRAPQLTWLFHVIFTIFCFVLFQPNPIDKIENVVIIYDEDRQTNWYGP